NEYVGEISNLTPPASTAPPSITGSAAQGSRLTEHHGTWTNSPTGFGYRWEDCDAAGNGCTAIPGATGQTYVLAARDAGHTIRLTLKRAGKRLLAKQHTLKAKLTVTDVTSGTPHPVKTTKLTFRSKRKQQG